MVSLCLDLFFLPFVLPCVLFLSLIFSPCKHVTFCFIFFHTLHRITLEIMTLQPKCEDVETAEGVAITVTGVAQVNHHTFLGMPVQTQLTPTLPPSSGIRFWSLRGNLSCTTFWKDIIVCMISSYIGAECTSLNSFFLKYVIVHAYTGCTKQCKFLWRSNIL